MEARDRETGMGDVTLASGSAALDECVTPIQGLPQLSELLGVDLRVKRDDLFPSVGGGNKARRLAWLLGQKAGGSYTDLLTVGGVQSNLARATALAAAERGWRCHLVLHGDPDLLSHPRGNLLLALLAGAEVKIVPPEVIEPTVQAWLKDLQDEGKQVLHLDATGTSVDAALPFVHAAEEVGRQLRDCGWEPDYIVLASGTGTSQAGLVVGAEKVGWNTRVIGISVARPRQRAVSMIEHVCDGLRSRLGIQRRIEIEVRDDWVAGGYARWNDRILESIRLAARSDGLILDPVYTGKAFTGLRDLAETHEMRPGSRVLFWHTGGLVNLLSEDMPELFPPSPG